MSNRQQPHVLIVDDEPRNIRLIEGMLFGQGYELLGATSGADALDIINDTPIDLVLLDVMMPGLSGFEVCQQIKSHPRHRMIPVVMVTALTEVNDRVKAMEVGADDFLSKPVDATELMVRVRSLVRVRQLNAEVERVTAERLRFMAGVAHDIRTPLNALTLSMELLEDKASGDRTMERALTRMNTCVEHIRMLASDVMNYYKIESGEFQLDIAPCPLIELVEQVAAIAQPIAAEKDIALSLGEVPDLTIEADQNALSQILLNLLTNSIKYSDPGAHVALHTCDLAEADYQLPPDHHPPVLTLPTSGVLFEVSDTGHGIAPADFERVFSEFDRLHANNKDDDAGVGLGLPVSQRLIRLHGGEIWFSSQPGAGSTFSFFLPIEQS
jgi:signal transduction histidine kinase